MHIFICGTPGVGKTTFAAALTSRLNDENTLGAKWKHLELAKLIRDEKLYTEWDHERNCSVFDDAKVMERLQEVFDSKEEGEGRVGWVVDFHSAYVIDPDLFEVFVVLKASTREIYDRLKARGYDVPKVEENVQCEIFNVVQEELQEVLEEAVVAREPFVFENDTMEAIGGNISKLVEYLSQF